MCVCASAPVCVCVCVCVRACARMLVSACVCVCVSVYLCGYMYVGCVCIYVHIVWLFETNAYISQIIISSVPQLPSQAISACDVYLPHARTRLLRCKPLCQKDGGC